MVKDNLSDILRVKWNRMSKPTEIWRTAKPVIRYYYGPDGAKVATFDGSTRVDYVHDPSGQLMAVYETVERGDSAVLPTLNPEGKYLRAVLTGNRLCKISKPRDATRPTACHAMDTQWTRNGHARGTYAMAKASS